MREGGGQWSHNEPAPALAALFSYRASASDSGAGFADDGQPAPALCAGDLRPQTHRQRRWFFGQKKVAIAPLVLRPVAHSSAKVI